MPTYTINMGQDQGLADAIGQGMEGLVKLATPDYEGMANAKVRAAQATNSYASADAATALAEQRRTETAITQRELDLLRNMDAELLNMGITDQAERAEVIGSFGAQIDPQAYAKVMADNERALEQTRIQGENAIALEQAKPIVTDGAIIGGVGDPRFEQFDGGIAPFGNEITGGNTVFRPDFDEEGNYTGVDQFTAPKVFDPNKAPATRSYDIGLEKVTEELQPDGTWKEIARAPRSTKDGAVVTNPLDAADAEWVDNAYGASLDAGQQIYTYDTMLDLLDAVDTGPMTELTMPLRQLAANVGIDMYQEDTAILGALNTYFGRDVMSHIQDTKGAVSDKEMAYFKEISPTLGKGTMTNKLIILLKKKQAERLQQNGALIKKMYTEGRTPAEIQSALNELYDQQPLSSDPEIAAFIEAAQGEPRREEGGNTRLDWSSWLFGG